jgi:CO dehydrogenase maturation factor
MSSDDERACPYIDAAPPEDTAGRAVRIAIAGKGGSGKTTLAATLARLMARAGRRVVAVDADTNPNLGTMLGLDQAEVRSVTALPRTLLRRETQPDGSIVTSSTGDPAAVLNEFGARAPDSVTLVVMGAVGHGGAG